MASDLNVVALVGRITKDCTEKSTGNGSFIDFSLAVNRSKKGKSGNWEDEVNYFNITYFAKNTGIVPYLVKGQQVSINGSLIQEVWEQNGQKRYAVKVKAFSISLLAKAKGQDNNQQQNNNGYNNQQGQYNQQQPNGYNTPPQGQGQYNQQPRQAPPQQNYAQQVNGNYPPPQQGMPQVGPEDYDDEIPF